ncbi:H-NS family nucleoid-associated regulatory protein [Burkholderia gladioli]|uniref:H-NS histone family protein n=1 Tax=Burkholderia gladioli TaxID=28095 RepID=UPI0016422D68|nr:H-NS histone family protein [Burkholderia gladioli]
MSNNPQSLDQVPLVATDDAPTIADLEAQLREINARLGEARKAERRNFLQAVAENVSALGISQDELLIAAGFKKPALVRAPAKYYDPNTGKQWSGRGPRPQWLQGKNLDEFLIDRAMQAPQPWWPGE